ncbi:hypothetical protein D1007_38127 [Hordeum vulgare]|nr:hypothetical protein D1007_38127 [Hordeum vulgare]
MQYTGPTYRFPSLCRRCSTRRGVRQEHPPCVGDVKVEGRKGVHRLLPWGRLRAPPSGISKDVASPGGHPQWVVVAILAHFTNPFDAFYLLGRVFWYGCKFIAFASHNIFTYYDNIFPTAERMHTLPYPTNNTADEH